MLKALPRCLSSSRRYLALTVSLACVCIATTAAHADGAATTVIPAGSSPSEAPRAVLRPRVAQGPIGALSEDDRAAARAAMHAMEPAALHEFRLRLKRATPDERADMLRAIGR